MKIMTGKTGTPHVTSQQFRQFVEATVGQDSYILQSGENLEPELQTNNSLKIRSGIMAHHGNLSVVDLGTYDEVTIANGTQGRQRIDLVVNRYTRNESTGVEENEWVVIQGAAVTSNPSDPSYIEGNLQNGDLVDDCPVFRIHLNGINVTEVEKLLDVAPSIPTLNASLAELSDMNRYVFLNMQARSVPGSGENYLNVASVVQDEGDPSIVSVTTGSAAIRVRQPGRYLMIVRLSVATADPNIEVNAYRWNGSEYEHYRGIASVQVHGMMPLMTVVSVTETDGRIAIMITNNKTSAVSIGAGTAIILIPLF